MWQAETLYNVVKEHAVSQKEGGKPILCLKLLTVEIIQNRPGLLWDMVYVVFATG